ncbi:putative phosphoglycerate mutase [Parvularcula bermudensis HTCC2503]|uniref:Putative phosphoglycerate mutase n=1 Tax=Parvularcula bermudensis (strain ATCC BAA-594 / HTCC2503 / KCTC 12087) TaxID=314260 RepID=E0TB28_PARBH|nr:histidine phosphatase family protein [Parvularcula bermudensis]ADM08237.1 putative phosphoglycerate mutase [Parvularcula bermudensis HTCC2503]
MTQDDPQLPMIGRRRLYLMRHGHVDYFAPGLTDFRQVPLTEHGCAQARAAGVLLSDISFDAVFTSGLPRTQETARLVLEQNDRAGPTPINMPTFEELAGGKVVAKSREELAAWLAFSLEAAADQDATFLPGGESFADAFERSGRGLSSLITDYRWRQALLVAHDGINRLLLSRVSGAGLKGVGAFEQDLACINVLDFDVVTDTHGGVEITRTIIKAVNVTAYDVSKAGLRKTSLEHLFDIDFDGARPQGAPA